MNEYDIKIKMSAFDKVVSRLCSEIDDLTEEVTYWKNKYDEEKRINQERLDNDFKNTKEQIVSIFKIIANTEEDRSGNLIIRRKK